MSLIRAAGSALVVLMIGLRLLRLAATWRLLGTAVVAVAWAVTSELLLETGLVLWQGRASDFFSIVLLVLLPPLVGVGMAYRYWSASEFDPRPVFRQPLVAMLGLLLALTFSGLFLPLQ